MVAIYGLIDPRDGRIRFVGQTKQALKHRLSGHCSPSIEKTPKHIWIQDLKKLKLKPDIILLANVSPKMADKAERFWIKKLRTEMPDLLNQQAGGKLGYSGKDNRVSQQYHPSIVGQQTSRLTTEHQPFSERGLSWKHKEKLRAAAKLNARRRKAALARAVQASDD